MSAAETAMGWPEAVAWIAVCAFLAFGFWLVLRSKP